MRRRSRQVGKCQRRRRKCAHASPQHFRSPWKAKKPRGASDVRLLSYPSGSPQRRRVSVDAGCAEVRMPGPLQQGKRRVRALGACSSPSTPPLFSLPHAGHRHSTPQPLTPLSRRLAGSSARDGAPQEVQLGGKGGRKSGRTQYLFLFGAPGRSRRNLRGAQHNRRGEWTLGPCEATLLVQRCPLSRGPRAGSGVHGLSFG